MRRSLVDAGQAGPDRQGLPCCNLTGDSLGMGSLPDPIRTMAAFVLGLESAVGRGFVYLIIFLFCVGMASAVSTLVRYAFLQPLWMRRARDEFATATLGPEDVLDRLVQARVPLHALVYTRIAMLAPALRVGRRTFPELMAEISQGRESVRGALERAILNMLVLLGLAGTVWGLSEALVKIQPLIGNIEAIEDLMQIGAAIRETVAGMSAAFATTFCGLAGSLLLGPVVLVGQRAHTLFLAQLEAFLLDEALPSLETPGSGGVHEATQHLARSSEQLASLVGRNVPDLQVAIQQLTSIPWEHLLYQQHELQAQIDKAAGSLSEGVDLVRAHANAQHETTERIDALRDDVRDVGGTAERERQELAPTIATAISGLAPALVDHAKEMEQEREAFSAELVERQESISAALHAAAESIMQSQGAHNPEIARLARTVGELQDTVGALSASTVQMSGALEGSATVNRSVLAHLEGQQEAWGGAQEHLQAMRETLSTPWPIRWARWIWRVQDRQPRRARKG